MNTPDNGAPGTGPAAYPVKSLTTVMNAYALKDTHGTAQGQVAKGSFHHRNFVTGICQEPRHGGKQPKEVSSVAALTAISGTAHKEDAKGSLRPRNSVHGLFPGVFTPEQMPPAGSIVIVPGDMFGLKIQSAA